MDQGVEPISAKLRNQLHFNRPEREDDFLGMAPSVGNDPDEPHIMILVVVAMVRDVPYKAASPLPRTVYNPSGREGEKYPSAFISAIGSVKNPFSNCSGV